MLTNSRKFAFRAGCFAVLLLAAWPFGPKTQAQPRLHDASTSLPPEQLIERELAGEETHAYHAELGRGDFLQVFVEQKGVDVLLSLFDSNGRLLAQMDSPNGKEGTETLSFVAAWAGVYTLRVSGYDDAAEKGTYTLLRTAPRAATEQDRKRVEVERAFVEALRLRDAGGRVTAAVAKFEEALRGWRELDDDYMAELTAGQVRQLKKPPPSPLPVGVTTARQLQGDETHTYTAQLQQGQILLLDLEEQGADVWVTLELGLEGQRVAGGDRGQGYERETLTYLTEQTGTHILSISARHSAPGGGYQFVARLSRTPTDAERNQVAAETLLAEGLRLYRTGGKEESPASIAKLEQAAKLWNALGEKYWEAYTYQFLGRLHADAGAPRTALDYFKRALLLSKATGHQSAEAVALNNLAAVQVGLGEVAEALEHLAAALARRRAIGDRRGEASVLHNLGETYMKLGAGREAVRAYEQALLLRRAVGDRTGEASELSGLGSAHFSLGEEERAVEFYTQAARLHRSAGNRRGEAVAFHNTGVAYGDLGEWQKAVAPFNQALLLWRALGERRNEAEALNQLGKAHDRLGGGRKALEYYDRAVPLWRGVGDQAGEARALDAMAKIYSELGERQKALEYFHQVLPLRRALGQPGGEAEALQGLGRLSSESGEKRKALEYLTRAVTLYEAAGDQRGEALALNDAGIIHSELGEKQKALEYFNEVLSRQRAVSDQKGEAATLHNLASVYSDLGEQQKALQFYEQALPLRRAAGHLAGEAVTLNNLGSVYLELGDTRKGLAYLTQALPIYRAAGDRKGEAAALNNLGLVHFKLGERQKALEYYAQALPQLRAVGDLSGEAAALSNLGVLQRALGQIPKALDYLHQALPLRRAVGDRGGEAWTLNNLSSIHFELGETQKALESLTQSLPLHRAIGDRRGESVTLHNLMVYWASLKNPRLAILYGKQSVNVAQSLRTDIQGLDRELQRSFLGEVERFYRTLAELLIKEGRLPEAERVLEMLKEEEYFELVRRDDKVASTLSKRIDLSPAEREALARYEKIADEITRLGNEYARLEAERLALPPERASAVVARQQALDKVLDDARTALRLYLEELKKEFSREDKRVAAVEEGLQSAVKGWGDPHLAVISTLVGKENLSIIVTTPDIQRAHIVPIPEEKLNKLVADFRAAVMDTRSDPRPAGQLLYDALVGPLEKDLEGAGARTLVWSLDGNLRYAPLAALWDKGRGYLAQRYASVIITLASRDNLVLRPGQKTGWQALGLGVSKAVGGFDPLSNVVDELRSIVRDPASGGGPGPAGLIAGRLLLNEQFTYDAMLSHLGRYPYVHAATHFSFIPGTKDEALESFLLLGSGEKLTLARIQTSGTIFNGVQLLALSACDTAYGGKDADGREVEGFGAMAQKKGAKAVLASLWRVADASTRELMVNFYTSYGKDNLTKAEALRRAQLSLLQDEATSTYAENGESKTRHAVTYANAGEPSKAYAHPYYWAPFILIGNWW